MNQAKLSFSIITELRYSDDEAVTLILERLQEKGVTVLAGGMITGEELPVKGFLETLFGRPELTALDSMEDLKITRLQLKTYPSSPPDLAIYSFEATIGNVWKFSFDEGSPPDINIEELSLIVAKKPQATELSFLGRFELFEKPFDLGVQHTQINEQSNWEFHAQAKQIQLGSLLTKLLSINEQAFGLDKVTIDSLEFNLTKTKTTLGTPQKTSQTTTSYAFRGGISWDTGINLVDGGENLLIEAEVELRKGSDLVRQIRIPSLKNDKTFTDLLESVLKPSPSPPAVNPPAVTGEIIGLVSADIPFFESLNLAVIYQFGSGNKDLIFSLKLGSLGLTAKYSSTATTKILTLQVSTGSGSITFRELLAYVVSLYDPSLDDFELDSPWDMLGNKELSLGKVAIKINLTKKKFTVYCTETLDLLFFKVSDIGLSYQNQQKKGEAKKSSGNVRTTFTISIPGQPSQRVEWDPVNENPPAAPGEGVPLFDLKFLAVGQRVSFHPTIVQKARNISQVMNVMRQTMVALPPAQRRENPMKALQDELQAITVSADPTQAIILPPGEQPIRFNAASGLLLGAQFTVMDTLDMSIIFNDPLIYGLRIELSGEKAKKFAGLQFEILYRRISDTIGVYHTELVLPDAMRQMEFGAVSLTLPIVAIDIYTNGDFSVDFGFPWKGDFNRSFAIQAGSFTGSGGFYFSKLSAETATSVPAITNGKFNPVYEFGLGLRMGLGRSFNKGVLQAELSIQVHGILQGVVARFNPSDPTLPSDDYYIIQGGVGIVGRIYGSVDFEVIRIDVEVIARATVIFKVEAYQPALLMLEASVSVRASIKVVFVRIHFSFDLTVREEFTLGSASPTPWRLAA